MGLDRHIWDPLFYIPMQVHVGNYSLATKLTRRQDTSTVNIYPLRNVYGYTVRPIVVQGRGVARNSFWGGIKVLGMYKTVQLPF